MRNSDLDTLKTWVRQSRRIVFFGGAGVSTESGIPDFRGENGLYRQKFDYPPEEILSCDFFYAHTEEFYRFYREFLFTKDAKPNAAHRKLAQWEREGRLDAVITQNIDGLHQKAGNRRVLELHGSASRFRCTRCGARFGEERLVHSRGIPLCDCGGVLKPEVVLYGEQLDEAVVNAAIRAIGETDLLIVGGTSLTVYPAAGLLVYYPGTRLVLINRDETPCDREAALLFRNPIGEILGAL